MTLGSFSLLALLVAVASFYVGTGQLVPKSSLQATREDNERLQRAVEAQASRTKALTAKPTPRPTERAPANRRVVLVGPPQGVDVNIDEPSTWGRKEERMSETPRPALRFETETEGESVQDMEREALRRAKDYFGDIPFRLVSSHGATETKLTISTNFTPMYVLTNRTTWVYQEIV